jgi:hypothetical protein
MRTRDAGDPTMNNIGGTPTAIDTWHLLLCATAPSISMRKPSGSSP